MVTVALTAVAAGKGLTPLAIVELVIIASWVLFFAVMLIYAAVMFTARGRGQRQRQAQHPERRQHAGPRMGTLPPGVDDLRRVDPDFDGQLLLDAAQTATLLVFVATTTGDTAPVSRLVTGSFWSTPFGRISSMMARDRRREAAESARDGSPGRKRWNIPLDYHPSVPEIRTVSLGREQRVTVRVSFGQLQAVIRPDARELAAGAAARSFGSAMVSMGKSVAIQTSDGQADSVSWLAAGGDFDLTFVRPSGATTDPFAAVADRTCTACGATYQSELAIACEHCRTPRALPWGNWRLALAEPVR